MVTRADVENAKNLVRPRFGDPYVYGGMFSPTNIKQGTDCSGVWNDVLGLAVGRFQWGREPEGATTESYRYIKVGEVGPFGTIRVARPQDIPANAAAKLAFHHEGNGGESSHMWGELDGMRIESRGGGVGLITAPAAKAIDDGYANAWAYLPGPIAEDGTPAAVIEPGDTLFADVSEFQVPVTDAYTDAGYRVLTIRSNDGTHRDTHFAQNYAWCKQAADDGRLAFFIVYFYWRPGSGDVDTCMAMVNANGGPHPKMAVMVDVESGGNPGGDQSPELNAEYDRVAAWLGDHRRVIAYANLGDARSMWRNHPDVGWVIAGYGSNPNDPLFRKVAHQYTDGQGYGGGLPEGAPPFGNCDMNSADGLTATAFAAALGIQTNTGDDFMAALSADEQREMLTLLRWLAAPDTGELRKRFPSRSPLRHLGEGLIDTAAGVDLNDDANDHVVLVIDLARIGDPGALALLREVAGADPVKYPDRQADRALALRILTSLNLAPAPTVPTPTAPAVPAAPVAVKVSCQVGGGACTLVDGAGDGTCALGGSVCVLTKGAL